EVEAVVGGQDDDGVVVDGVHDPSHGAVHRLRHPGPVAQPLLGDLATHRPAVVPGPRLAPAGPQRRVVAGVVAVAGQVVDGEVGTAHQPAVATGLRATGAVTEGRREDRFAGPRPLGV